MLIRSRPSTAGTLLGAGFWYAVALRHGDESETLGQQAWALDHAASKQVDELEHSLTITAAGLFRLATSFPPFGR